MKVAQYIEGLSQDIGYEDKANKQMGILKSLINEFEQQELPKTRNEFETRAMLFQMLHDIENFLNAKLEFMIYIKISTIKSTSSCFLVFK